MENRIRDLNQDRKEKYFKNPEKETFIQKVNEHLIDLEEQQYQDLQITHPFIFIFGLPRSGTTLLSQLLAHCLDTGYINNFMARFWKAPVCGIKLSKIILENEDFKAFNSEYGSTYYLQDIHEFGYFWRDWLNKETYEAIRDAKRNESDIDWEGLRRVLANMQAEFDKPMVFKNILGSYHLKKLKETVGQVIYVYITRDELDVAVSILNARKKYYDNINRWWSYAPPEVLELQEKDYWHQIGGQIHYLKKFYREEIKTVDNQLVVTIDYKTLCSNPEKVLNEVHKISKKVYNHPIERKRQPPQKFNYNTHHEPKTKEKFQQVLNSFRHNE